MVSTEDCLPSHDVCCWCNSYEVNSVELLHCDGEVMLELLLLLLLVLLLGAAAAAGCCWVLLAVPAGSRHRTQAAPAAQ
jgi:hypothetical protein